jgi:uncharacterized membrane protein YgcG
MYDVPSRREPADDRSRLNTAASAESPLNLPPDRRIIDGMTPSPSIRAALAAVITFAGVTGAQNTRVTPERVRFVLSALAHDSMEGRAMGSRGSMRAAAFIAEQFKQIGLTPAGDSGYFQHVPLFIRSVDPNSTLSVDGSTLKLGVDFSIAPGRANPQSVDGVQVVYGGVRGEEPSLTPDQIRGKLVIFQSPPPPPAAAATPAPTPQRVAPSCRDTAAYSAFMSGQRGAGGRGGGRGGFGGGGGNLAGAAGVATIDGDKLTPRSVWTATHPSSAFTTGGGRGSAPGTPSATFNITTHAAEVLLGVPLSQATKGMAGKTVRSTVAFNERPTLGGNVIGIIEGTDPVLRNEHILIDAHYDHLGINLPAPGSTDSIYNGADDDASGTTAVIEIARAIKAGAPPKRTLVFAATTGEEVGLVGTQYYIANPVRPLASMAANLEIEMIDRPDSLAGGFGKAWLTGYERSTMGDTLAARGVPLVQDPRPEQNFFQRSDNIAFARMGIPAHTISTFNLHTDYHRASDEVRLANFDHMAAVINASVTAARLLSDGFKPAWHPGCKP